MAAGSQGELAADSAGATFDVAACALVEPRKPTRASAADLGLSCNQPEDCVYDGRILNCGSGSVGELHRF